MAENDYKVIYLKPPSTPRRSTKSNRSNRSNQSVQNTQAEQEIPNEYKDVPFGGESWNAMFNTDINSPQSKLSTLVNMGYLPGIYGTFDVENASPAMLNMINKYYLDYLTDQAERPQFRSDPNEDLREYDRQRREQAVRSNQINNAFFLNSMPYMSDRMAYMAPDAVDASTMGNGFTANLVNAATGTAGVYSLIERLLLGAGSGGLGFGLGGGSTIANLGSNTPMMIARGINGQTIPMALTATRSYSPWLTYLLGGAAAATAGAGAGMGIREYMNNNSYSGGYGSMRDDAATGDNSTDNSQAAPAAAGGQAAATAGAAAPDPNQEGDNSKKKKPRKKATKKEQPKEEPPEDKRSVIEKIFSWWEKNPNKSTSSKSGQVGRILRNTGRVHVYSIPVGISADLISNGLNDNDEFSWNATKAVLSPERGLIKLIKSIDAPDKPSEQNDSTKNDSIQSKQPDLSQKSDSTTNNTDTITLMSIDQVIPDQKKIVTSDGNTIEAKTWDTRYPKDKDNKKK